MTSTELSIGHRVITGLIASSFITKYKDDNTVEVYPDGEKYLPDETHDKLIIVPPITQWTIRDGNAYTLGMKILRHLEGKNFNL